jgi:hypothetical protein
LVGLGHFPDKFSRLKRTKPGYNEQNYKKKKKFSINLPKKSAKLLTKKVNKVNSHNVPTICIKKVIKHQHLTLFLIKNFKYAQGMHEKGFRVITNPGYLAGPELFVITEFDCTQV